jgi:hypothetical protein
MEMPFESPNQGVVENKVEPPTPTLMPIPSMLLQNSTTGAQCALTHALIIAKFFPMALALLSRSNCIFSAFS